MKTGILENQTEIEINTRVKAKSLLVTIILVALSNLYHSQTPSCNYLLTNNSNCQLGLHVDFYDSGGLCKTVSGITLFASSTYNAGCGSCGPLTDVVVVLEKVGGTTLTTTVSVNTTTTTNNAQGCPTPNIDIDWAPSGTVYHY